MRSRVSVLDASVCVAWFFTDEPLRKEALAVRADVRERPSSYVVPPLFYSEMIHVLARKSGHDRAFVMDALSLLIRFGMRTISLTEEAMRNAADWACMNRLSGYDATYLALAQSLDGEWLTADERAVKSTRSRHAVTLSAWNAR